MPYPRFTKVIIHYFLSKHSIIPKRHGSRIHCIKDDGVLGKLKFVSKGEPAQVYGMTIPDVMINDDIKKSKAYQTYLAISSGIVDPKKERKGMKATATLTKKGSITADENILSDPDEALQLGELMSLTKEEIAEEERRVQETHANATAQELLNFKKGTRASREAYILQQIPKGSSEGSSTKPDVLDEPKGSSAAQSDNDD
ncbi:hypothetical protein Tco_0436792 [Tanacetum coccineum]